MTRMKKDIVNLIPGNIIHYVHKYEDKTKVDRFGIVLKNEEPRGGIFRITIKWLRVPNSSKEEHHYISRNYSWNMLKDVDWFFDETLVEIKARKII